MRLATLVRLLYAVWLFFATSFIVLATAGRVRRAFRSAYETVQLLLLAVFLLMGTVTRCALDTADFAADCVLDMLSDIIAGTACQVARLLLGLAGTMSWIAHQVGVTTLELVVDSWVFVTNSSRVATEASAACAETLSNYWPLWMLATSLEHSLELSAFAAEFAGSIFYHAGGALLSGAATCCFYFARMAAVVTHHSVIGLFGVGRGLVAHLQSMAAALAKPAAQGMGWLCKRACEAIRAALGYLHWATARAFECMCAAYCATSTAIVRGVSRVAALLGSLRDMATTHSGSLVCKLSSLLMPVWNLVRNSWTLLHSNLRKCATVILDSSEAALGCAAVTVLEGIGGVVSFSFKCGRTMCCAIVRYALDPLVLCLVCGTSAVYQSLKWVRRVSMDRLRIVSMWAYYYVALPLWNTGCRIVSSSVNGCLSAWRQTTLTAVMAWSTAASSWRHSSAFVASIWCTAIVPRSVKAWRGATALVGATQAAAAPSVQKALAISGTAYLAMQGRFCRLTVALSYATTTIYARMAFVAAATWNRASGILYSSLYGRLLATYASISTKAQLRYAALYARMAALQERVWLLLNRL